MLRPKNWVNTRRITSRVSRGESTLHAIPSVVRLYFCLKSRLTSSENKNAFCDVFFRKRDFPMISYPLFIKLPIYYNSKKTLSRPFTLVICFLKNVETSITTMAVRKEQTIYIPIFSALPYISGNRKFKFLAQKIWHK